MTELVDKIFNKEYEQANASLKEELAQIIERKIAEKKKMIAADLSEGKFKEMDIEQQEKEEREKKKKPNLPPYGGKKTITRNVFRKTSDRDVADKLKKEIEDAQEKEDKYMREEDNTPPFVPDVKKSTDWKNPKKKAKSLARKAMKAEVAKKKDIKEAVVDKDGMVELPTGERVLASVYRQRRWLAEENLEADNAKVEAALAKAKMLLFPQLDTEAPKVNRKKVVRPKGGHAHVDHPPAIDEGPRESEWESGEIYKGK